MGQRRPSVRRREDPIRTPRTALVRHIDAGVTLGDIFHAVVQDPGLVTFLEQWSRCDLEAFHSEARETIHVSGIGHPDENGVTNYGLDFTPVNQLVHLPVRLRPDMEIRKDHKKLGEAPRTLTLLDILGEIC